MQKSFVRRAKGQLVCEEGCGVALGPVPAAQEQLTPTGLAPSTESAAGFEVGMHTLIFLIALAFVVVAPLVLPLVLLFFAMSWLFW